jgi:uncharacterized protein YfeS
MKGGFIMKIRRCMFISMSFLLLSGCSQSGTSEIPESDIQEKVERVESYTEHDATENMTTEADVRESENVADYKFDKDSWITSDGVIDYPFDQNEILYASIMDEEKQAYYCIPQEALDLTSTKDLLELCCKYILLNGYIVYEQPGDFLTRIENDFNALCEVESRADFGETLLAVYQELEYMPENSLEDPKEQLAYDEEALIRDGSIVLCEILLARDDVFSSMTDDLKSKTLEAVHEKQEQRNSGKYKLSYVQSSFYAYIAETEYEEGNSSWYIYLKSIDDEAANVDAFSVGDHVGTLHWPSV